MWCSSRIHHWCTHIPLDFNEIYRNISIFMTFHCSCLNSCSDLKIKRKRLMFHKYLVFLFKRVSSVIKESEQVLQIATRQLVLYLFVSRSFDEYGISEKDEDSYPSDQQIGGMNREVQL